MKILHVIDSSGVWGAEKMLFALVAEQLDLGNQCIILSIGKLGEDLKVVEAGMAKRNIPFQTFRMSLIPRLGEIKNLVKSINEISPDVIHSHGYKGNILLAFIVRLFINRPMVTTMHGWVSLGKGFSKLAIYEWLDSFAVRWLDGIVLVSEKMLCHPRIKVWPMKIKAKAVTINNGISTIAESVDTGFVRELKTYRAGSRLVGSVGRLSEEKGYQFLIPAFAELLEHQQNVKLVLIGDGHYRYVLESLIKKHRLENLVWITGYIENAGALIGELDIYVCSSLTEGLPITLLEAMRESVPIISTAISNIPALLQDGLGGELVEPSKVDALSDAMAGLLNCRSLREQYTLASRKNFSKSYTSEVMSRHYLKLYRSVIEPPNG